MKSNPFTVTLALTGASGAPYAVQLLKQFIALDVRVYLLISNAARVVLAQETNLRLPEQFDELQSWIDEHFQPRTGQVTVFDKEDWFSPVASGSSHVDAMVICPASGGALSAIANGASNNLIERAADVVLKEKRTLVVVPRETPVSQIHLENMLKLSRMGAHILPASPGFYQNPNCIDDLVNFVVARILSALRLPQTLLPSWGDSTEPGR